MACSTSTCADRTRMAVSGTSERISRAASRPSVEWPGGIRMSTMTSSGRCWRTRAMSCRASPHCPTTSKPERSSRLARPSRSRTSSSASATRIGASVTFMIIICRPVRRAESAAEQLPGPWRRRPGPGMSRRQPCRRPGSVTVGFAGIYLGCVGFQRLLAFLDRLFRRVPPVGAEDVAVAHLGEPVAQLDQVDLVLLELGVGEVAGCVLLHHLGKEVLAAVHDFLVLVVPCRLERVMDLRATGQYLA